MKFWDASAVVPLIVGEERTSSTLELYRADPELLVWTLTPVEVFSALSRKKREGALGADDFRVAARRLEALAEEWSEVQAVEGVKDRARRLLRMHPLGAADALQLGAALLASRERPRGVAFVCYDRTLAAAAEQEGFEVFPEP